MKFLKTAVLLIMLLTFLSSCDINSIFQNDSEGENDPPVTDNGGEGGSESDVNGDYVNDLITFDKGETVMIVVQEDDIDNAYTVQQLASDITGKPAIIMTDDRDPAKNELVLGNCDRDVSREAYIRLENEPRDHVFVSRIAFYSNGNSVAIAYDDVQGYSDLVMEYVIDLFRETYVTPGEPVSIPEGEFFIKKIDFIAYQKEIDAVKEANYWERFEQAAGAEATEALRTMYDTIYSGDMVSWLANLYDIETGGFYFSNSARDYTSTIYQGKYSLLLPEIESTDQALDFINQSGMLYGIGTLETALPDWMREAIIQFVKKKQDPNGYFYHPQWTHEMVDNNLSRRGRDVSKGTAALKKLGAKPTYNTPNGVIGDGILWDGTPVSKTALTMPIDTPKTSAVSFVVATNTSYPAHMKDKESFVAYINSLNDAIAKDSYTVGNQLASQADQIKARDITLKKEGADYSLALILKEWLDSKCYPTTGHWSSTPDYPGLNGFLKISATYQALGLELPYPEAAARSSVDSIELSGRYPTACFAYNSWYSVCNIISNVTKHKSKEEAERIINNIRTELYERAPELIEVTMRKQGKFLLEDGSFMYIETGSSGGSQGLPVSVTGSIEGTVNSHYLCTVGTLEHMFYAFGYPSVPILYPSDFNRFISIIEENRANMK